MTEPRTMNRSALIKAATAILLLGSAGGLTACGSSADESGESKQQKVRMMLDWKPGSTGAVVFWGQEKGLFKDAGVDLQVVVPSDTSAPLKLVATNKLDLAMSYEADTLVGMEQGLDVQAVGAIYPRSVSGILAMPDSGIRDVADLKGKRIGYSGIPSYKAYLDQMLKTAGLGTKDVELVNVGFNDLAALFSKKVDALGDSFNFAQGSSAKVKAGGKEPFFIRNEELGVPSYNELVFVANSKKLKSDKAYAARVTAFLSAYEKSRTQAVADPDQALKFVQAASASADKDLAVSTPKSLAEMAPTSQTPAPACMDQAKWAAFADWMLANKLLKRVPPVAEASTNAYLGDVC